jgi:hypothetical protein
MSAINVDSIVTVRISDKNNDWLEFTIRQTAIPNDYVIRELLCTIEMTTKENRRVQKTFQLTKFRPHFFANDKTDRVLYAPHEQDRPTILRESCVGSSIFAAGDDTSGSPGLTTYAEGNGNGSDGSYQGSSRHRVPVATTREGYVTSSTTINGEGKSKSSADQEFRDAVARLGGATLYEPKAKDVIAVLSKSHSKAPTNQEGLNHPRVIPIGPVPPAKAVPGTASGGSGGQAVRPGEPAVSQSSDAPTPLVIPPNTRDLTENSKFGNGSPADVPVEKRQDSGPAETSPVTKTGSLESPSSGGRSQPEEPPGPASRETANVKHDAATAEDQGSTGSSQEATRDKPTKEEFDTDVETEKSSKHHKEGAATEHKKKETKEKKEKKEKKSASEHKKVN